MDWIPDLADTRELLLRAQRGDDRAFEQLFSRHDGYLRQVVALRIERGLQARIGLSDVRGDHPQIDVSTLLALPASERPFLLDVRTPQEHSQESIADAVNIPLDELRSRWQELPANREIVAFCQVGQRGYLATRILRQAGLNASNLSGGYKTYRLYTLQPERPRPTA